MPLYPLFDIQQIFVKTILTLPHGGVIQPQYSPAPSTHLFGGDVSTHGQDDASAPELSVLSAAAASVQQSCAVHVGRVRGRVQVTRQVAQLQQTACRFTAYCQTNRLASTHRVHVSYRFIPLVAQLQLRQVIGLLQVTRQVTQLQQRQEHGQLYEREEQEGGVSKVNYRNQLKS